MDENLNVSPHGSNTMLAEVPVRIQRSRQHKQVSPNGLPIQVSIILSFVACSLINVSIIFA